MDGGAGTGAAKRTPGRPWFRGGARTDNRLARDKTLRPTTAASSDTPTSAPANATRCTDPARPNAPTHAWRRTKDRRLTVP